MEEATFLSTVLLWKFPEGLKKMLMRNSNPYEIYFSFCRMLVLIRLGDFIHYCGSCRAACKNGTSKSLKRKMLHFWGNRLSNVVGFSCTVVKFKWDATVVSTAAMLELLFFCSWQRRMTSALTLAVCWSHHSKGQRAAGSEVESVLKDDVF